MSGEPTTVAGLIGLLDTFALTSEGAVHQRVVDSAAENYGAEIVAVVGPAGIGEATGLGGSGALHDVILELAGNPIGADSWVSQAELKGLGAAHVASLPIGDGPGRLLMIRSSGPFDPEELRGCRAMIRIMRLAIRSIGAFDEQVRASQRLAEEEERNRSLSDELQRRHHEFTSRMRNIQELLTASSGPVLESIVHQAEALLYGEVVALQLLRDDGMLELVHLSDNAPPAYRHALQLVPQGEGLAGLAMDTNELVMTESYGTHERALPGLVEAGVTASVSAPLRRRNEVVGALTVSSLGPERPFTRDEIETILLLAGYASMAMTDALTLDQRQRALEEAEWQATHDPLTGLANRRLVTETVTQRLATSSEMNVLYIDVDRFKAVNDRYGHHVGDLVIKEVANRINAATRSDDLVGRLAGDEFIVVFGTSVDLDQANLIAERIRRRLDGPALIGDRTVPLSVSIGIATSEGVSSADDVINIADVAMYQAKSDGRNQVGRYNSGLRAKLRDQAEMADRLEMAATSGDGFHLVYQPMVEIDSEIVMGHEVLLRWVDPILGSVPPDVFIPLAEELGIIARIDDWVLDTALAEVMEAGNLGGLSVNVSPPWLARTGVAELVAEVAEAHGFPLDRLTLEVTERVAMADGVTTILSELRALGIRIMLDDFGTGYSSLAYVRTLEIDGIKIDRRFLQDIETDRHTTAILEAVVTLTDRLGASAIAEGVETQVQARLLAGLGCRLAQGYYFGRPLPAHEGLLQPGDKVPVNSQGAAADIGERGDGERGDGGSAPPDPRAG